MNEDGGRELGSNKVIYDVNGGYWWLRFGLARDDRHWSMTVPITYYVQPLSKHWTQEEVIIEVEFSTWEINSRGAIKQLVNNKATCIVGCIRCLLIIVIVG